MGELDDLEAAGTGGAGGRPVRRGTPVALDEALERLDLLDDLESLQGGGVGGLATGVEIFGEQLAGGPHDALLDAFEPVRDLADHTDVFDDLF